MSRDKKRQMIWYQVDDGEAAARRLEKMARKGWLLEAVDNWYYTYRRSDPTQVKYAVTFFPDASYFDPGLMEGQETYAEYCQAAGWELAAAYGPIQYFLTANPDPPPIETDETIKLTAIRRTMRKTLVLSYAVLLLLPAMGLPLALTRLRHDPMEFFCSNIQVSNLFLMLGILLFAGGMLLDYLIWLLRSRYAVAHGGACCKPHTRFRLFLTAVMMLVCAASVIGYLTDASWLRSIFVFYLAVYGGMMILARWVLRKLKKASTERSVIRAAYIAFAVIAGLIIGFGATALLTRLVTAGIVHTSREPAETYAYTSPNGSFRSPRSVYHDDLPVTLEDLGYTVTTGDHCSYEEQTGRTLLASRSRYTQGPLNPDSALPDLTCQVYDTRWPWLLQTCWKDLIADEGGRYESQIMQRLDPAPWGAAEAYRQEGLTTYYLLYANRIVTFHLSGDAAPRQLDAIAQALRP